MTEDVRLPLPQVEQTYEVELKPTTDGRWKWTAYLVNAALLIRQRLVIRSGVEKDRDRAALHAEEAIRDYDCVVRELADAELRTVVYAYDPRAGVE